MNEIEKRLLSDVYERDVNNGAEIHENNYGFEGDYQSKRQALVYYVDRLKNLDFVKIDCKPDGTYYTGGGWRHTEYGNSAIMIDYDRIHITNPGINQVKAQNKTKLSKLGDFSKKAFILIASKTWQIIAGILIVVVAGVILWKIKGQ